MHSYQTLAVLALAVSTASPAFSAPLQESQEEARAIGNHLFNGTAIIGVLPVVKNLSGSDSTPLNGTDPIAPKFNAGGFPGNLNKRAPASANIFSGLLDQLVTKVPIGKAISSGLVGGLTSGAAALGVTELANNTRREPFSSSSLSSLGKTLVGIATGLAATEGVNALFGSNSTRRELHFPSSSGGDDVSTSAIARELLILLRRELEELD